MAEFAYNNAKNASTHHNLFELNYTYHPCVFFEKDTNPCFQSKNANKLLPKLWKLMTICQKNFYHAQKLQKQAYNKSVKSNSFARRDKVWLNSKYIKTKQNWKLEAKFFGLFKMLHFVVKQAYKLELSKRWKIYNLFEMSLLEQDIIRKGWVDKKIPKLEFEVGNSKK